MKTIQTFFITAALSLFSAGNILSQPKAQIVRLARLEIDSAQLDRYNALLKEEIVASVLLEPGVLTLYAMSEKNKPTRITILEIYVNVEAYQSHLLTPTLSNTKRGRRIW
jgi:quinol monooxygenase YgiN